MAFDKTPTTWLPSYTYSASTLGIPLAAVPWTTAAKANASTGDIRSIAYGLLEALTLKYNSLATADRPAKMTLSKSATGVAGSNNITVRFAATFTLDSTTSTLDVAAE